MPDLVAAPGEIADDCLAITLSGGEPPLRFHSEEASLSVGAHTFRTGDRVKLIGELDDRVDVVSGGEFPETIDKRTTYFVVVTTANTIGIAEVRGGEPIEVGDGTGHVVRQYIVNARVRTTSGQTIVGAGRVEVK